jgi:hypothetical protein
MMGFAALYPSYEVLSFDSDFLENVDLQRAGEHRLPGLQEGRLAVQAGSDPWSASPPLEALQLSGEPTTRAQGMWTVTASLLTSSRKSASH